MSKSDFTCVAWFSDLTKALEYTVDVYFSKDIPYILGIEEPAWVGCRIHKRHVVMFDARFDDSPFNSDTVIEKVNSSTVGEGWAVWVRKPKPEWTEWKTFVPAPWSDREYRVVDNGNVEYREKKNG